MFKYKIKQNAFMPKAHLMRNCESSVATSYYQMKGNFHSNKNSLQILVTVINLHQSMTIAHICPNLIPHPSKKIKPPDNSK